jgi:hypothetical protein
MLQFYEQHKAQKLAKRARTSQPPSACASGSAMPLHRTQRLKLILSSVMPKNVPTDARPTEEWDALFAEVNDTRNRDEEVLAHNWNSLDVKPSGKYAEKDSKNTASGAARRGLVLARSWQLDLFA